MKKLILLSVFLVGCEGQVYIDTDNIETIQSYCVDNGGIAYVQIDAPTLKSKQKGHIVCKDNALYSDLPLRINE